MLAYIFLCCLAVQSAYGELNGFELFDSDCGEICPEVWEPVCGSDGITYGNACVFNIAQCRNEELTLAAPGPCLV
ncbi:PI-actitoxin-Avd5a-like [Ruditapes philippinarum]|uniref:PI-actitoxin-Avd5a-like n=1 Tax=Ruditapes philippinarum TaxID=129788 RepID=UPI00295B8252|nr:PI-actitoxin-Avd5a-like [Ruditapes philippinarum]